MHDPAEDAAAWDHIIGVGALPASFNPAAGFIVSANNRPAQTEVPIGYFFSPDDRVSRLTALLEGRHDITQMDLHALQTDVLEPGAAAISQAFTAAAARLDLANDLSPAARAVLQVITGWDGGYGADAPEPVAFEATFFHFLRRFYTPRLGEDGLDVVLSPQPADRAPVCKVLWVDDAARAAPRSPRSPRSPSRAAAVAAYAKAHGP